MNADKILALASRKEGVTYYEAHHAIGGNALGGAGSYITKLIRSGKMFKSGVKDYMRYFTDKANADAYQIEADAARLVRIAELKEKVKKKNALRMKERRAKLRQAKPPKPPKPPKVKKAKVITPDELKRRESLREAREARNYAAKKLKRLLDKKPKAQNIVIETKQQAIDKKRTHLKAVIEWPEHVKVQVIEGFKGDTRYQPEPGFVGSFKQELLQYPAFQQRKAA